jgi:hypothetical protein
LFKEFEEKLLKASQDYLRTNIDSLKDSDPSKAYTILKKMGAQPGECDESSSFTLLNYLNMKSSKEYSRLINQSQGSQGTSLKDL